jgi:hypothetical protein
MPEGAAATTAVFREERPLRLVRAPVRPKGRHRAILRDCSCGLETSWHFLSKKYDPPSGQNVDSPTLQQKFEFGPKRVGEHVFVNRILEQRNQVILRQVQRTSYEFTGLPPRKANFYFIRLLDQEALDAPFRVVAPLYYCGFQNFPRIFGLSHASLLQK